jgi:hypothetical protein
MASQESIYYTNDEVHALTIMNMSVAGLSLLGSIFIISVYVKFTELRSFAFKLVFLMTVCDFFRGIGHLLGDGGGALNDSLQIRCQMQGFLKVFFGLASIMWCCAISFSLHMAFLREVESFSPANIERHNAKFHLAVWGVALVGAIIPFITESYGDVGPWCFITESAVQFACFYSEVWVAVIYNSYVFISVFRKLSNMGGDSDSMQNKIKYYPLVLVIAFFFATINRVYQACGGGHYMWLTSLHVIFTTSQGLLNAIVDGFTDEIKTRILSQPDTHFSNMEGQQN